MEGWGGGGLERKGFGGLWCGSVWCGLPPLLVSVERLGMFEIMG